MIPSLTSSSSNLGLFSKGFGAEWRRQVKELVGPRSAVFMIGGLFASIGLGLITRGRALPWMARFGFIACTIPAAISGKRAIDTARLGEFEASGSLAAHALFSGLMGLFCLAGAGRPTTGSFGTFPSGQAPALAFSVVTTVSVRGTVAAAATFPAGIMMMNAASDDPPAASGDSREIREGVGTVRENMRGADERLRRCIEDPEYPPNYKPEFELSRRLIAEVEKILDQAEAALTAGKMAEARHHLLRAAANADSVQRGEALAALAERIPPETATDWQPWYQRGRELIDIALGVAQRRYDVIAASQGKGHSHRPPRWLQNLQASYGRLATTPTAQDVAMVKNEVNPLGDPVTPNAWGRALRDHILRTLDLMPGLPKGPGGDLVARISGLRGLITRDISGRAQGNALKSLNSAIAHVEAGRIETAEAPLRAVSRHADRAEAHSLAREIDDIIAALRRSGRP